MPIGAWLESLVDTLFPPRCLYCRRMGSHFCQACRDAAQWVGEEICVRCGQPLTERNTCAECRRKGFGSLRGMRGVVFYGGPVTFAIHGFKYQGKRQLASPLAAYLNAYLQAHPVQFGCVVPVPLHPDRLAFRGYNQSELLAAEVARSQHIPMRADVIARTRHTPPQVHLNRKERIENVNGAFAPVNGRSLSGETCLLIDDVCTTGSTLRASGEALRAAGAGDVWALTVARARPQPVPEPWQQGLSPAQVFQAWDARQTKRDIRNLTPDT
ncbi:MAG: ComF family protein [Caldilineales bacterium]|nr:ComF family protein [Caldilineales bacterium]